MATKYTKDENEIIEKAILFLVTEYEKTGSNEKPVIFHSLRVACKLVEVGASATIVTAAILHDLIEDTNVDFERIKNIFGSDVAKLVDAVSFKPNIVDKEERYKEMFERTKNAGTDALKIKCADILDNSSYYSFGLDQEHEKRLINKLKYFLFIAEPQLDDFPLFQLLNERYQTLLTQFNNDNKKPI
jgi:GTP pyrophosphokinase